MPLTLKEQDHNHIVKLLSQIFASTKDDVLINQFYAYLKLLSTTADQLPSHFLLPSPLTIAFYAIMFYIEAQAACVNLLNDIFKCHMF